MQQWINVWFWLGLVGSVVGLGLIFTAFMMSVQELTMAFCVAIAVLGWSALMVGVVGKGVELGVRAANDE